ncbi:uncharacterized protein LOC126335879 [Schistocerca gregaria]|uniref:uncharacterized protein LOC126335879 n=1 Tax=Schistocerca gregaria TaxID=7010 RepID=UPI00211ECB86|nr:uncharacterized protein LOC126335879 [Schistocerca gregaria]
MWLETPSGKPTIGYTLVVVGAQADDVTGGPQETTSRPSARSDMLPDMTLLLAVFQAASTTETLVVAAGQTPWASSKAEGTSATDGGCCMPWLHAEFGAYHLHKLYISENTISDLTELSNLQKFFLLQVLDMRNNKITELSGYRELVLHTVPSVKHLDGCEVTYVEKVRVGVSHTTRPKEPNEIDGVYYHFVSQKEFDDLVKHGEFMSVTETLGSCYGFGPQKSGVSNSAPVSIKKGTGACMCGQETCLCNITYTTYDNNVSYYTPESKQLEEIYIRSSLKMRQEYLDMHYQNPGFFSKVIFTDDLDSAYSELMKFLKSVYRGRLHQIPLYSLDGDHYYQEVVCEKLDYYNNIINNHNFKGVKQLEPL